MTALIHACAEAVVIAAFLFALFVWCAVATGTI